MKWNTLIDKIANSINKINLKQRLIISMVLITLLSISITTFTIMTYSKNIIENKMVISAQNSIGQISKNVDESITEQVYNISNMLMFDKEVHNILTKDYSQSKDKYKQKLIDEVKLSNSILNKYLSVYKDVKIAVLCGKNNMIYNIFFPPKDNLQSYEKFKNLCNITGSKNFAVQWYPLQENFITSRSSKDIRENKIIIASRSIVFPETQEYIGTCIFSISEQSIFDKYSKIELGNTGEIFIINSNGELISHSDETKLNVQNEENELTKKVFNNPNNVFTSRRKGENILVITRQSSINGWITVGIVPINEIYGEVNRIYKVILIIILCTLLIAISVMIFISDRVVKPIRKIIQSMEKVEKGNLNVRVNIKGEYEVSNLGKYFNNMIRKIKQLIKQEHELERKKKEAELDVLMAQINPHFIYNTLESIVWMAESIGASEISKMTSSLGRLLRIGMRRGTIIVPVSEEIEHVKAYIDIQKIRYGDKFDIILNIKDESIRNYHTLKFILQPLVENAFYYSRGQTKNKVTITISIKRDNDKLVFTVKDNGIGINEEEMNNILSKLYLHTIDKEKNEKNKHTGVGIKNIHERIKLYFGNEYGIRISSIVQKGTEVSAILPAKCQKKQ